VRILIADDHEVVRKGVRSILESQQNLEIVGEATNGQEAVQKACKLQPDLVVLDVSMPMLDGFSAARQIRQLLPAVPILMLSMHAGPEMIRASKSAGAQGFVTKTEVASTLLNAVDALLQGHTCFTDSPQPQ
jgi:DNA-binding NarL/FixJ family response regulator